MSAEREIQDLRRLAHLYGVETTRRDLRGRRTFASPEGLRAILRSLGAPIERLRDVAAAWRERHQAEWQRPLEPVVVAWDGGPAPVELRLPQDRAAGPVACRLDFENGETRAWTLNLARLRTLRMEEIEGVRYVAKGLSLPGKQPFGHHRLSLEMPQGTAEALIVSAPTRAYGDRDSQSAGSWGVFLPLYALQSDRSWAAGDFSDLEALLDWANGRGARAIATLPLLATFLDEPFDPSPYAPASRVFWNEFYVDITRIPELRECASAQAQASEAEEELRSLRSDRVVDYRRGMALKRKILEPLANCFFGESAGPSDNGGGGRHEAFCRFLEANPMAEDYACFRAVGERERAPWPEWPERLREGRLQTGDYDEEAKRYHLYAQWQADEQLRTVSEKARRRPPGLCLDLPLGLHPAGYDVWRHREAFVGEMSAGAPPDILFTGGQNWGFPPLHPETRRQRGHAYMIACLRQQLRHAGLLRVDHVMGLHRLFWIPKGLEPAHGAYVQYPAEELYAILCLESHRHKSLIVGENLGTVPRYVNPTMARHNIKRMYVVQYVLAGGSRLRLVPSDCVASLNTHDMPTFAAFWEGLDIEDRSELGFLSRRDAIAERKLRQAVRKSLTRFFERRGWLDNSSPSAESVARAFLKLLSASRAEVVLVNIEDLWGESQPQNVPGTTDQRPNWQRKARYSLEEFFRMTQVLDTLREVDRLRSEGREKQIKRQKATIKRQQSKGKNKTERQRASSGERTTRDQGLWTKES
ncbi:MAG: 4-alpha-glucanotransferase [Acidobacteria bacterium]|nr:MAG: 4-alpha-glucanotransferase [Acidobacteriota bacterium]